MIKNSALVLVHPNTLCGFHAQELFSKILKGAPLRAMRLWAAFTGPRIAFLDIAFDNPVHMSKYDREMFEAFCKVDEAAFKKKLRPFVDLVHRTAEYKLYTERAGYSPLLGKSGIKINGLLDDLKSRGVTDVYFLGGSIDACIESYARQFTREFKVSLIEDLVVSSRCNNAETIEECLSKYGRTTYKKLMKKLASD